MNMNMNIKIEINVPFFIVKGYDLHTPGLKSFTVHLKTSLYSSRNSAINIGRCLPNMKNILLFNNLTLLPE